jgi:hypothetical protein
MEGIVWTDHKHVVKRFYPWAMDQRRLQIIQVLAQQCSSHIVSFDVLEVVESSCIARYADQPFHPVVSPISIEVLRDYLMAIWRARVVTSNIKRDNLRLTDDNHLVYIDIGVDIVPLSVTRFMDCAARIYATLVLGWSDFELTRRETTQREEEILEKIPGFSGFYHDLIGQLHPLMVIPAVEPLPLFDHRNVSLLIKCCPQDEGTLRDQVHHLIGMLAGQTRFARRILLVDPFEGPYLREFDRGNLQALMGAAQLLLSECWIDEIWIAPQDPVLIAEVNARWFGTSSCTASHTTQGAPVTAQLWAFERITSRYVLQLDVDVLIGRVDPAHDYLEEMLQAIRTESVWCVGFNIPKAECGYIPYASRPNGYAPEIRLGLLDLARIRDSRPFHNPISGGRLTFMWHRALEHAQSSNGMQSVRGGDSRSFYLHPMNRDKGDHRLPMIRDLVAQARYPKDQAGQWDLDTGLDWRYPSRDEDVVFLLLGRGTTTQLLRRCLASLLAQSRQDFGVIVVDDGGETLASNQMQFQLGALASRTTLVRHSVRQGYLANFQLAAQTICTRPETLLVVLDQDDALMSCHLAEALWQEWRNGADMIHAPMFRPDKPLRRYTPNYRNSRSTGGGNVWAHLRAFRIALFLSVPDEEWDRPVADFDVLSDFLTMIPMAELAKKPTWLDEGYAYLHQRAPYSAQRKAKELKVKQWLGNRTPLKS